jgi:hypothetical protein
MRLSDVRHDPNLATFFIAVDLHKTYDFERVVTTGLSARNYYYRRRRRAPCLVLDPKSMIGDIDENAVGVRRVKLAKGALCKKLQSDFSLGPSVFADRIWRKRGSFSN